ncbi:MAG: hypothetical protein R3F43_08195 [bacterium]
MDFSALIDAIVRQTTVLIAHLATAAGVRAPLAHVANQVFLELVRELEAQGLGRKVVADMFGIALRSYQLKVQRLSESATDRQRTLWNATLDFIQTSGPVSRTRVMQRFAHDDEGQVRAVLHDLVESGLVYRTGGGLGTAYRAASPDDLGRPSARIARPWRRPMCGWSSTGAVPSGARSWPGRRACRRRCSTASSSGWWPRGGCAGRRSRARTPGPVRPASCPRAPPWAGKPPCSTTSRRWWPRCA